MDPSESPLLLTNPPAWLEGMAQALEPWRGRGVVAAVSGGSDSVALLRALVAFQDRLEICLTVATFDHSTRGGESARDAAFVAELAAGFGLHCDLGRWEADRPGGWEADARRARYAWLVGVARSRGALAVATGHTRDDQAETILHRVVRGTGLRGLGGMAVSRPLGSDLTLVRPLLAVGRVDLRAYLATLRQTWREDATNADSARTRSRLRHDLLPQLAADYNPDVAGALVRLGSLAADASARLDRRSTRLLGRVVVEQAPHRIVLDRARLRQLDRGDRLDLLRAAWRGLGWPERAMNHTRWLRLDALAAGFELGRVAVGRHIEVSADGDLWTLQRVEPAAESPAGPPIESSLPIPGAVVCFGGRIDAALVASAEERGESPSVAAAGFLERLDADRVVGSCVIRLPRGGDRLDPLGLDGRTQALADLLRGRKVARADRLRIPIVADSVGIIWVVGHRIAHRVQRTATTNRVLELRWESANDRS